MRYQIILYSVLFLMIFLSDGNGQQINFSGNVTIHDQSNSQDIDITCYYLPDTSTQFSTLTNNSGDFSMNLDTGTYRVIISYTGYYKILLDSLSLYNNHSIPDTFIYPLLQGSYNGTLNGTFVCDGILHVDLAETLEIAEGTIIYFTDSSSLEVQGDLIVSGTEGMPVQLTSLTDELWKGIRAENSSQKTDFRYTNISNTTGRALYSAADTVLFYYSSVTNAQYQTDGGGIFLDNNVAYIRNSFFESNRAERGAAIFSNSAQIEIEECKFKSNNTTNYAGAVYIDQGRATINRTLFTENNSKNGGALVMENTTANIQNSIFYLNGSDTCAGGALKFMGAGGSYLILHSNFIYNNANQGAAVYSHSSKMYFYNSDFSHNGFISGSAIYNEPGQSIEVGYCNFQNPIPNFQNCPGLNETIVTQNHKGIPCDEFNNIYQEPGYENLSSDVFLLRYNSALIESGWSDYTLYTSDYHLSPRTIDGDLDGTNTPDIGAFEFQINPVQITHYIQDASTDTSSDGNIIIEISGGLGPYSINWNHGTTNDTLENLMPGTYIVSIGNLVGPAIIDTCVVRSLTSTHSCSISGSVLNEDGMPCEADVVIFRVLSDSYDTVYVTEVQADGSFELKNLKEGEYILQAVPTGNDQFVYASTFYSNGTSQESASRLNIIGQAFGIDIIMPMALNSINWNQGSILLYPNPAINQLHVVLDDNAKKLVTISLTNLAGKTLYFSQEELSKNHISIDVSNFTNGIYLFKISDGRKESAIPIIIHK